LIAGPTPAVLGAPGAHYERLGDVTAVRRCATMPRQKKTWKMEPCACN